MLQFLKSSVWSFLSVFFRTVSSLAITKLFAVYYGPNGITLLSHFQNLIAIITTIPNGGINVGIIKYLAGSADDPRAYRQYFLAGFWLNGITFLLALLALLLSRGFYFEVFLVPELEISKAVWLLIFALGMLLLTLNLFLLSALLARKMLKAYVYNTLVASVGSLAVTWFFAGTLSIHTILLAYLIGQSLAFFHTVWVVYRQQLAPAISAVGIDKKTYTDISKFILMAVSSVVTMKLVDFFVRDYMIERFDLYQTGLWQAVVKISDNYTMVFTSVLGMVYYPKIASLLSVEGALKKYVRSVFFFLVPAVGGGLLFFYVFKEFFILLLFDRSFLAATYLLDYQLIGDFLKMAAWVLSYIISVQANVRLYILTQLLSAVLYVGLIYGLLGPLGLEGITVAHAIRYGLYLLFHVWFFRKLIF